MTQMAMWLFDGEVKDIGFWAFLTISSIGLFVVFIPLVTWMSSRRKEREAFYKAETFRRVAEASGDGAKAALEMLREEDRLKRIKTREATKIGGVINIAVGIGLIIFLRSIGGPGSPFLCGIVTGLIGIAMLVYVYVMARPLP